MTAANKKARQEFNWAPYQGHRGFESHWTGPECFVSFDDRMNISHKLDIIFYPEYRLEFTQRLYEGTGFATEHKKDPFVNLQCSLK